MILLNYAFLVLCVTCTVSASSTLLKEKLRDIRIERSCFEVSYDNAQGAAWCDNLVEWRDRRDECSELKELQDDMLTAPERKDLVKCESSEKDYQNFMKSKRKRRECSAAQKRSVGIIKVWCDMLQSCASIGTTPEHKRTNIQNQNYDVCLAATGKEKPKKSVKVVEFETVTEDPQVIAYREREARRIRIMKEREDLRAKQEAQLEKENSARSKLSMVKQQQLELAVAAENKLEAQRENRRKVELKRAEAERTAKLAVEKSELKRKQEERRKAAEAEQKKLELAAKQTAGDAARLAAAKKAVADKLEQEKLAQLAAEKAEREKKQAERRARIEARKQQILQKMKQMTKKKPGRRNRKRKGRRNRKNKNNRARNNRRG